MSKKQKFVPTWKKNRAPQFILQLAMSMVAVVIGVALYAENIFSPVLALATSGLSYLAFRSLHNLVETTHKVESARCQSWSYQN